MRKKLRMLLCFYLIITPLSAFAFDSWRMQDYWGEGLYLSLHYIDWKQTRQIAKHSETHSEINPIIGPHPSLVAVNRYCLTSALLHIAITHVLPHDWRECWLVGSVVVKFGIVNRNAQGSIGWRF